MLRLFKTNKSSGPDTICSKKTNSGVWYNRKTFMWNFKLLLKWTLKCYSSAQKDDTNLVENYRPLLSILSKRLKIIHFQAYLNNFIRKFITKHLSGFTWNDYTGNQLIIITNMLSKAIDDGKYIRVHFFHIGKFLTWCGTRLLSRDVYVNLNNGYCWWSHFMGKILFDERKQRVVINGRESSCNNANADGPQGPILDPLLFIFFINEIVNEGNCPIQLFANATT